MDLMISTNRSLHCNVEHECEVEPRKMINIQIAIGFYMICKEILQILCSYFVVYSSYRMRNLDHSHIVQSFKFFKKSFHLFSLKIFHNIPQIFSAHLAARNDNNDMTIYLYMECFDCNDRCTIELNTVTMFTIDLNKFAGPFNWKKIIIYDNILWPHSFRSTACVCVRFFISMS